MVDLAVDEIAACGRYEPEIRKSSRLLKSKSLFAYEGNWSAQFQLPDYQLGRRCRLRPPEHEVFLSLGKYIRGHDSLSYVFAVITHADRPWMASVISVLTIQRNSLSP